MKIAKSASRGRGLEVVAGTLGGLFLIGSVATADQNKECSFYGSACSSFSCQDMGGVQQCTSGGVQFNWTNLTQIPPIIGTCGDGTGDCSETPWTCVSKKYSTVNPNPVCDDMTTLKCSDAGTTRNGCK